MGAPTEFAAADIVATVQARELDALTASQKSKVQHYISCIRGGGVTIDNYQPTAYLAAVLQVTRLRGFGASEAHVRCTAA
jgi:hypothetical protein